MMTLPAASHPHSHSHSHSHCHHHDRHRCWRQLRSHSARKGTKQGGCGPLRHARCPPRHARHAASVEGTLRQQACGAPPRGPWPAAVATGAVVMLRQRHRQHPRLRHAAWQPAGAVAAWTPHHGRSWWWYNRDCYSRSRHVQGEMNPTAAQAADGTADPSRGVLQLAAAAAAAVVAAGAVDCGQASVAQHRHGRHCLRPFHGGSSHHPTHACHAHCALGPVATRRTGLGRVGLPAERHLPPYPSQTLLPQLHMYPHLCLHRHPHPYPHPHPQQ